MRYFFTLCIFVFLFAVKSYSQLTVGETNGYYSDLKAAFDDINAGTYTGDIVLEIIENAPQYETAVLYPSGYQGLSDYTSVTIFSSSTGAVISGDIAGPLIELSGAANVTFDGRLDMTGTAQDLVITNTNTGSAASTIRFTESAANNVVRYCFVEGSSTASPGGVIFFSTSSTGSGNDNNTIEYCKITGDPAGRPVNGLFSLGTSGRENSGNTISNNSFYDLPNTGLTSYYVNLANFTTAWNITGNSFYETTDFIPTANTSIYGISINNTSGINFNISGNYIGGNTVSCGGTPYTKTAAFTTAFNGIIVNVGTGTATSIQNNVIRNISWSNAGAAMWTGIQTDGGDVNIGTVTGNYIGDDLTTGSVTVTNASATNASVYGINLRSAGTTDCRNNKTGSITGANAATLPTNIYAISNSGTGSTTIASNTIGSTTAANSIYSSSICSGTGNQNVFGIYNTGTGNININGNTIANLTNGTNNSNSGRRSLINGIYSAEGTLAITNNIIRDLTISNANNAANQLASICGISLIGATYPKNVNGNTIYNLRNNNTTINAFAVIGIYFVGTTSSNNNISGNFIHSLSVNAASTGALIYGIKIQSGTSTYYNNIISLGGNTPTQVTGIFETGSAGNNNNIYFNTVYIGGSPTSGSRNSHAFYSTVTTNARDFRNNVFHNARSNSGASGSHYAIYIVTTGGTITCDYNDYYVSGTGGMLGYYGGNKAALPVVTGQDASSYSTDPVITVPGSTTATDYTIGTDFIGATGTGITTDFGAAPRNNPTPGAWERIVNKWRGTTSTAWNIASNWTGNSVPIENSNIIFDDAAVRDLYLNTNHSVRNITNSTSYKLVTNGHQLTIRGDITVPGGSQVNATAASSTIAYEGSAAQAISSADFVSGKAYNVEINNTAGVTLNSNFTVDNNLTISTGSLTISAPYLLTVTGTILNTAGNSGLVLKSTGNGVDAKLINSSVSVPATVELSLSGGGSVFHYFEPGIQSMTFDNSSIAAAAASLGLANFNGDLLLYDETKATTGKNAGWQYFDGYNGTTPFNQLLSSRGYNIHVTAADRMILTGDLNGAQHTFNLSYTGTNPDPGWNLVGNPFPSNYDLTSIAALVNTGDEVDNTVYFNYEGGYGTYNVETGYGTLNGSSSTLYSNIMPPMQGFFVRARNINKSLVLPVSGKTSSSASPARSKSTDGAQNEKNSWFKLIRLTLADGPARDETLISLYEKATDNFDSDYDAYKLFETDVPYRSSKPAGSLNIPSIYSEMKGIKYAMNFLPEPEEGSLRIPLSVRIKRPGSYTIEASEFENLNGTKVVLKHGSTETLLGPGISYTFRTDTGTYRNFELIIGEADDTAENTSVTDGNISVWYKDNQVFIKSPAGMAEGSRRLVIYDLQGKPVYEKTDTYLTPEDIIAIPVNLRMGIYIIRINDSQRPFVSRVVITE